MARAVIFIGWVKAILKMSKSNIPYSNEMFNTKNM